MDSTGKSLYSLEDCYTHGLKDTVKGRQIIVIFLCGCYYVLFTMNRYLLRGGPILQETLVSIKSRLVFKIHTLNGFYYGNSRTKLLFSQTVNKISN